MDEKTKQVILSYIDKNETINLLQEYIKIPSVSGEEEELAKAIQKTCRGIGMESIIDRHGNVISTYKWKKSGPKLACNAHMDTVGFGEGWSFNPIGGEVSDRKIYGRGAVDDKGQIVSQIMAAKAIITSKLKLSGELVLCHVVEEEVQNVSRKGTVKMLQDGFKADMAINGEASELYIQLVCGGMLEIQITTLGKRAHGSNPEYGINAIKNMCKVIGELDKLQPGYNEYTGCGSIVPGVIMGGERSSVVPDICKLKVSRFTVPGETGAMFYSQVLEIIERLKLEDPNFNARAELLYDSNPSIVSEVAEIVKKMSYALKDIFGSKHLIVFKGTPQHDDADFLTNMAGIPTLIFGAGKNSVAHIPDEYIPIDDFINATKVYAMAFYNIFS
ncbi:N-formyl-4-amino-5-aminomethyl-2-methylpyrimidine deformylase [subsurface metagenome]|nr:MAG: M20 family peptidase [Candidatus Atribacteria bacterium 1244-E10-H5-B2]